MVTELVANAIDHTDAPAIDLTVVAEGRPCESRSPTTVSRGARARKRVGRVGCSGPWSADRGSAQRRAAPADRERSVSGCRRARRRAAAGRRPDSWRSRTTVSLAPRRRSDPPPASSSFCSSEQHGETCGRDEARSGEVNAECRVAGISASRSASVGAVWVSISPTTRRRSGPVRRRAAQQPCERRLAR